MNEINDLDTLVKITKTIKTANDISDAHSAPLIEKMGGIFYRIKSVGYSTELNSVKK